MAEAPSFHKRHRRGCRFCSQNVCVSCGLVRREQFSTVIKDHLQVRAELAQEEKLNKDRTKDFEKDYNRSGRNKDYQQDNWNNKNNWSNQNAQNKWGKWGKPKGKGKGKGRNRDD